MLFVIIFTLLIGTPASIVALVFHVQKLRPKSDFLFALNILSLALAVGTFVNLIMWVVGVYACGWVALGLGIATLVFGVAVLLFTFAVIKYRRENSHHYSSFSMPKAHVEIKTQNTSTQKRESSNYIEELKGLKELLDCGALTQEEYDKKKKEIIGK